MLDNTATTKGLDDAHVHQTRGVWGIGPGAQDTLFDSPQEIQNYFSCHPLLSEVLWNRGFRSLQEIGFLLNPELKQLPDPFTILNMDLAVQKTIEAILKRPTQIAVYGDYDVDGTCGTALLFDFFRQIGISITAVQPNRFEDGYGVHSHLIEKLAAQSIQLVITVDCGITAVAQAERAAELGVDLVVLDHHKLGEKFPEKAWAVVDPQNPADGSGLTNVCGTGLAFFFVMALRSELRKTGFFSDKPEPNLVKFLDLVAVATVADVMDIRGVNRILVTHGLKILNTHPRIGLRAILEASGTTSVKAFHCGFVIGPRINAAGRLQDAKSALDLLVSTDYVQAKQMAAELEDINKQRRATQDEVLTQALLQAERQLQDSSLQKLATEIPAASFGPWPRALVLVPPEGEQWHEGVLGIVASRLVEVFGRPAFVLTYKEGSEDVLKGSIRSIPKIDIISFVAMDSVAKHLLNYGGHAHAGGVTLEKSKLNEFIRDLNIAMALSTDESTYQYERRFDLEISEKNISSLNEKLLLELEKLEPYGHKFPEPVIKLKNQRAGEVRILKEKHLRIQLENVQKGIQALWFKALDVTDSTSEKALDQQLIETQHDYWVSMQWNEWQGKKNLQLLIKHAAKLG